MIPTEQHIETVSKFLNLDSDIFRQYLEEYRASGLTRWGGGTVEVTTAELLYILTRFKKPEIVIESGTNWGWSTANLAAGCRDSKTDHKIYTIDIDAIHLKSAEGFLRNSDLLDHIEFRCGDSVPKMAKILREEKKVDLVFIDSSHEYHHTKREFSILKPYISENTWVLFHDAFTKQYGVRQFIEELPEKWDKLILETEPINGFGVVKLHA